MLDVKRCKALILTILCIYLFLPISAKDKVSLLDNPTVSLQVRMSMIKNATKTLDIATYIYGNDEVSTQTLSEVIKAAERGVEVRLVIDALNNKIPAELTAYMIHKGIKIKVFNKFRFKKWLKNVTRMHAKITVSDHLRYIVGGRNIVNTYFYIGDQTKFRDREIFVCGRSTAKAQKSFNELWFSALLDELIPKKKHLKPEKLVEIATFFDGIDSPEFLDMSHLDKVMASLESYEVDRVDICMDKPHSYKFTDKLTTQCILSKVKSAKKEILIESPYIVLSDELYQAFQQAIDRGVRVEMITNSMKTSDSYLVLPVYFKERGQLVELGFQLFEYQSEDEYLHTKMFIFDRKELAIGSYNLDNLSANINTEILVVISDSLVLDKSLQYFYETKGNTVKATNNPMTPTLFEGEIDLDSIQKYAMIKLFEWTFVSYIRDYL